MRKLEKAITNIVPEELEDLSQAASDAQYHAEDVVNRLKSIMEQLGLLDKSEVKK